MFHFKVLSLKKEFSLFLLISLSFFATRLYQLRLLPIFTDEAIYIRWSQIALNDASFRFIPLTDGKQPLWHWFTMVSLKFIADPLLAGRLTSVLAGFAALIGIYLLAQELFNKKLLSWLAAFFYIFIPFTLFYDRLALVDSMLTMWFIYASLFAIKTAKTLKIESSIFTGFTIGAALLTKSPATFLEYLYPVNLLFIKFTRQNLIRWIKLLPFIFIIAEAMKNIMRLSPWMHMIARKNSEFIISFTEFFHSPFALFWGNIKSLVRWWAGWLTLPLFLASLFLPLVLWLTHKKLVKPYQKQLLYLYLTSLPLLIIAASFNKVIFARYLLFLTPPLILLLAFSFETFINIFRQKMKQPLILGLVLSLLLIPALYLDAQILFNLRFAPIIDADRNQYLDGFTAGWGIDEVVKFLQQESADKQIFLGTQGTFGLMPASFELYLWRNQNIEIKGYWPVDFVPDEVYRRAEEKSTYFIYYESYPEQIPDEPYKQLINKFQKGTSPDRFMYLYRVFPKV